MYNQSLDFLTLIQTQSVPHLCVSRSLHKFGIGICCICSYEKQHSLAHPAIYFDNYASYNMFSL